MTGSVSMTVASSTIQLYGLRRGEVLDCAGLTSTQTTTVMICPIGERARREVNYRILEAKGSAERFMFKIN
jgi:hypothetical protein